MDENIASVGVETDQEDAARLMERYEIFNLPVLDDAGRLVGVVHGFALGALGGVIAYFWKDSEYLALVVGVAMVANLVVARIIGVIVPLGFRALRIDPALSSAVAVTKLTDVLRFLVYLGLASALIRLIVGSL